MSGKGDGLEGHIFSLSFSPYFFFRNEYIFLSEAMSDSH